jgi:hypothetical protein
MSAKIPGLAARFQFQLTLGERRALAQLAELHGAKMAEHGFTPDTSEGPFLRATIRRLAGEANVPIEEPAEDAAPAKPRAKAARKKGARS